MAEKRIVPGEPMIDSMEAIAGEDSEVRMLIVHILLHINNNNMGSMGDYVNVLGCLDRLGIYGANVCTFYDKVCKNNIQLFIAFMKACRLGDDEDNQIDFKILQEYLRVSDEKVVTIDDIKNDINEHLPNLSLIFINPDFV